MTTEELEVVETIYLRFEEVANPDRKTRIVQVKSISAQHTLLGTIKWHGAWRQYVFHPEAGTLFNRGCLDDIQQVLKGMTRQHMQALRSR